MHKACPISELDSGQALRLDTAPQMMVMESEEAPNPLPAPTLQGHV